MTAAPEPIRAQQSWRENTDSPYESLAGVLAHTPRLSGARCRGSDQWDAELSGESAGFFGAPRIWTPRRRNDVAQQPGS